MNMFNWIRRKMKWKLTVVLSTLIVFIICSIGTVFYLQASNTVKRDVVTMSNQIVNQINLNLERYMMGYTQWFLLISTSSAVEQWLKLNEDKKLDALLQFQDMIDTYVRPTVFQYPEVISLSLMNNNGNGFHYSNKYNFNKDHKFSPSELELNGDKSFVMTVRFSDEYVDSSGAGMETPVLTMTKELHYGKNSGYLKVDIALQHALKIVNEMELGTAGYGLISNKEGQIIVHPDQSLIMTTLPDDMLGEMKKGDYGSFFRADTNEFVLFQSIQSSDWITIVIVPYNEFAKSIFFIRDATIIIAAGGLLVSILIAVAISSTFTKRIEKLRRMIRSTRNGKFDGYVELSGCDEVAELGRSFNLMLQDLNSTVHALAESKLIQEKAVMSALQSQIDSHFMYNTLESINSMAHLSGHAQIEKTTIALSKMLRYTSNYKGAVVTLQDEIQHLENYMDIMKIRLGDDFEYAVRVKQEDCNVLCLKAILQPIVENSVKHANVILDEPLRVHIAVSALQYDDIEYIKLAITDNGSGFSYDKKDWINRQIQQMNISPLHHSYPNIGLLNIHFRLKMYYQNDSRAGIRLGNSKDGHGAVVEVLFPRHFQSWQEVNSDAI